MANALRMLGAAAAALLLGACASTMLGTYRGPEPFGGKDYAVAPPAVRIESSVGVVVLVFKDDRPANEHDLDWTRQASNYSNTVGQPREVRREFDRAIKAGLREHKGIRIVSPEEFSASRDADLVVSGRILACEADRKMGWSTNNFVGRSVIEVTLRDGRGRPVWPKPLQFSATAKKDSAPVGYVDEVRPGYVAAAVEESIRLAVESFLGSDPFAQALRTMASSAARSSGTMRP